MVSLLDQTFEGGLVGFLGCRNSLARERRRKSQI